MKIKATLISDTLPKGTMGAITSTFDGIDADVDLTDSICAWINTVPVREIHIIIEKE